MTATVAMPVEKSRSSHRGETPRSIEQVIALGSQYWAKPITDDANRRSDADSESRRTLPSRSADRPRMFCSATSASAGAAITRAGSRPRGRTRRPQVLRDGDRPDRHDDQVVEQDRPTRDEAPELVEGVAGEGRGAAALDVERAALDVGGHRHDEERPGEQVDDGVSPRASSATTPA